jgi:large subunit ribosomal protein L25
VKTEGGLLEVVLREIDLECLPTDIPDEIECDVTNLGLHHSIRVRDLTVSDKVEILEDADQVVVHIVAMREEAEPEAETGVEVAVETAEGEGAEPEVMTKGKKDEEGGE